jgi:protein-tyrosine-phosphatase/catechol 2,3-dioxygenase-like lactoylglutathione lyase family enzyme
MAEALLRRRSAATVCSAGSRPKPVHPVAAAVMADRGIDLRAARPKHVDEFAGQRFDYVITLCDRVREICPEFPGQPAAVHWSIPDPAADPQGRVAFERVAAELAERIEFLLHTIAATPAFGGDMTSITDSTVHVRYLVDDVQAAIDFYTTHLGFSTNTAFLPAFADVRRGNLRLLLSGPASSAGRAMPDGRRPHPGGWNRIHLLVEDIDTEVARLRAAGVVFRSDVVTGPGGRQIVLDDSAGNPVELFQPADA